MTDQAGLARELEPVAARAWPAAHEDRLGDWRLYASSGFSGRINSCWPLGEPGTPLIAAIAAVEDWYRTRGLAPCFKIVEPAPDALESALIERGYAPGTPTLAMVGEAAGSAAPDVSISSRQGDDFAAVFAAALAAEPGDARERLEALERIAPPRFFAVAGADEACAVGACAVDGGWAGIFAMRTLPRHRRGGWAAKVLSSLLARAVGAGARRAWLQVEAGNLAALSLYRGAGFAVAYRYQYWRRA
jgi:ribosomal protein S18 acetylase RimI-like enzyme